MHRLLAVSLLFIAWSCDSAGPDSPPTPPGGPENPVLTLSVVSNVEHTACRLDRPGLQGGHLFTSALAHQDSRLVIGTLSRETSDFSCADGESLIYEIGTDGALSTRRAFQSSSDWLIGTDDAFLGLHVGETRLELSRYSTDATLIDTRSVVPVAPWDDRSVRYQVLYGNSTPSAVEQIWLQYETDHHKVLQAISPSGETLWSTTAVNATRWKPLGRVGNRVVAVGIRAASPGTVEPLILELDAAGTILHEHDAGALADWESHRIDTIVPRDDGGYWAVGAAYGVDFSFLLILNYDRDGNEVERIRQQRDVSGILHARELSNGDLAFVVGRGSYFNVENKAPIDLVTYRREGEVIVRPTGLEILPMPLRDVGDDTYVGFHSWQRISCHFRGCSGPTGFSFVHLRLEEIEEPPGV